MFRLLIVCICSSKICWNVFHSFTLSLIKLRLKNLQKISKFSMYHRLEWILIYHLIRRRKFDSVEVNSLFVWPRLVYTTSQAPSLFYICVIMSIQLTPLWIRPEVRIGLRRCSPAFSMRQSCLAVAVSVITKGSLQCLARNQERLSSSSYVGRVGCRWNLHPSVQTLSELAKYRYCLCETNTHCQSIAFSIALKF